MNDDELQEYFAGKKLYGDDFSEPDVEKWFEDEKDAYFSLSRLRGSQSTDTYGYHALNEEYGFRYLKQIRFERALGIGSARGSEFLPIIDRISELTILEPSAGFVAEEIHGHPVTYVEPRADGRFPFPDKTFDLITCLGVLHHIPNVSLVISEIHRCLVVGGSVLIREPTISMGDWRKPRPGLTSRERGIPIGLMHKMITERGFEVISERRCMFQLSYHLNLLLDGPVWNSRVALIIDKILCALFRWNTHYHPSNRFQTLRPISVFYVLRKPR